MKNLEGKKILVWWTHPNTMKEELLTRTVKNGLVKIDHFFYTLNSRKNTERSFTAEYSHS